MEGSSKSSEGIRVAIRVRPLNQREREGGQEPIFRSQANHNAVSQVNKDGQPIEGQTSYFDKVFDEKASNGDVYGYISKEMVQGVMAGINGTVFAYGQTSSGKTHTMLGGGDEKGVVYLAAEDIFKYISSHGNRDFLLRASFVEIYNENIRDLLSDTPDATVAIREDPRKGVYCEAVECVITDFDSILKLLKKGISRRVVEATAMNDTSSRSHTIFKLVVESRESQRAGVETDGAVLVSALNLVDLAGSESVRHTGAMGQRAKEGGKINQSLLSLSRVIHSLGQAGAHVNFRDSKLTRLLQPSLSGNAKMSIVCCITSAAAYLEETRSTLAFASRAKLVVTNAKVNEVVDETSQIRRLKKELEVLKEQYLLLSTTNAPGDVGLLQAQNASLLAEVQALKDKIDQQQHVVAASKETIDEFNTKPASGHKRSRRTWHGGEDNQRGQEQENIPPSALNLPISALVEDLMVDLSLKVASQDGIIAEFSDKLCAAQQELVQFKERKELEVASLTAALQQAGEEVAIMKHAEHDRQQRANDEEGQLTEMIFQMGALEEELATAKATIATLHTAQQDKDAMAQQLRTAVGQIAALTAQVDILTAAKSQQEQAAAEADRLHQVEFTNMNCTLETLQMEKAQLTQSIGTMQEHANEQLEEQLGAMQATMDDKVKEMENDLAGLQEAFDEKKEHIAELEAQLTDARASLAHNHASFDAALQASQKGREKADEECSKLMRNIRVLQQEILQMRSVQTGQDLAHESWQEQEQVFRSALEQLSSEKADLINQVNQRQESIFEVTAEMDELKLTMCSLQCEAAEARQHTAAMEEAMKELHASLVTSQGHLEQVKAEAASELQNEQARGQLLIEQVQNLQDHIAQLKSIDQEQILKEKEEINTLRVEIESKETIIADLLVQLDAAQLELENKADIIQGEKDNAAERVLHLQDEVDCLRSNLEDGAVVAAEAKAQVDQLTVEIASAELTINTLRSALEEASTSLGLAQEKELALMMRIDMMTSNQEQEHSFIQQAAVNEAVLSAAQEEISKLRSERNSADLTIQELINTVAGLKEQEEAVREQLDQAQAGVQSAAALQEQYQFQLAGMEQLEVQNKELQTFLETMQDELQSKDVALNKLLDERDGLESKLQALEVQRMNSQQSIDNEASERISRLMTENNELSSVNISLTEQVGALEQAVEQLGVDHRADTEQLQLAVGAINEQLVNAQTLRGEEIESLQIVEAQLRADLEALNVELNVVQTERDTAAQELEQAAAAIHQLTTALEEVDAMNQSADEDKASLQKVIAEKDNLVQQLNDLQAGLEEERLRLQHFEGSLVAKSAELEVMQAALSAKEEELHATQTTLVEQESLFTETITESQLRETNLLSEVEELKEKLTHHDKNASQEQEFIMEAAEMQMDALRVQIEEGKKYVTKLQEEKSALQRSEQALMIQVDKLMTTVQEKEFALQHAQEDDGNSEIINKLTLEAAQVKQQLSLARLETARKVEELEELAKVLETKDARIAHLDASKLTKDQFEKIKVIKEERKKYMEGYKTMKKQLAALKNAYDEMKAAKNTSISAPSQDFLISDLKFQLAEVNGQLTRLQEVNSLLKEKLKECSAQMEENEKERSAVVDVLKSHGIDTKGLEEMDDSSASSLGEGIAADLGEAVEQLAAKITKAQATVAVRSNTTSAELEEAQSQLQMLLLEGAESAAQIATLEKRLEAGKQTVRSLREENAEYTAQIQTLQEKLQEVEKKVVSGKDDNCCAMQVLEEENLELLRENKELLLEVRQLRTGVPAPAKPVSLPTAAPVSAVVTAQPVLNRKRSFGTRLDVNTSVASASPAVQDVKQLDKSASKTVSLGQVQGNDENAVPMVKQPRRVKAKPSAEGAPAETPECTQS